MQERQESVEHKIKQIQDMIDSKDCCRIISFSEIFFEIIERKIL